jgi:hypothetical protein
VPVGGELYALFSELGEYEPDAVWFCMYRTDDEDSQSIATHSLPMPPDDGGIWVWSDDVSTWADAPKLSGIVAEWAAPIIMGYLR